MPADSQRGEDNLFFGSSDDSFGNGGFDDPFSAPSDPFAAAPGDAGSDGLDGFDPMGGDAFGGMGSSGSGAGNGAPPPRRSLPLPVLLAIIAAAALLGLILLSRLFKPDSIAVSLGVDSGDILTTVTEQADGTFSVSLKHEVSGLDPSQFYIAGYMMAPEGEGLVAVGEPFYITAASSYTAAVNLLVTRPGTYSLAFYSYSLLNPLPSVTKTYTLLIGDGSQPALPTDEAPIVVVTPTPTPRPVPTPAPVPTVSPVAPSLPSAEPRKLRPDSDVFDLYDVSTRYYYHQLTDAQKLTFSELYDGVVNGQTDIKLTSCTEEDFRFAINAIFYDCPELFLLDYELHPYQFYTLGGLVISVTLEDYYRLSPAAYREQLEQVMQIIRSFSSRPDFGYSDYSRELAISNYIVERTEYDLSVPYCAYADSVYLYGYAKCTGYTCALNLALRYYGIPCASITGNTYDNGVISPVGHMWSLVQIDGQWYHCDATWNDSDNGGLYPYFNLNDRLMFSARSLEISTQTNMIFPLPECTSLTYSFAVQSGVYLPAGTNVTDAIARAIIDAHNSGDDEVIIMFESAADVSTAIIQFQNKGIVNRVADLRKPGLGYTWMTCADVNTIVIFDIH